MMFLQNPALVPSTQFVREDFGASMPRDAQNKVRDIVRCFVALVQAEADGAPMAVDGHAVRLNGTSYNWNPAFARVTETELFRNSC